MGLNISKRYTSTVLILFQPTPFYMFSAAVLKKVSLKILKFRILTFLRKD